MLVIIGAAVFVVLVAEDLGNSSEKSKMKVIIVGGVAGGASCAARLRRLDENAEIVMVERAVNIPLGQLRARLDELPRDKTIQVLCRSGQRAYYATRMLMQQGFDARIVSGGMLSRTYASFFLQDGLG